MACGTALVVYCLLQIYIVRRKKREPDWFGGLELAILAQLLLLALQALALALALYWIHMVAKLPEQVEKADGGGRWNDHYFDETLAEMEHAACETYRTCCRDPRLAPQSAADGGDTAALVNGTSGGSATCLSSPERAIAPGAGGALTVLDPSQPGFCAAISGGDLRFGVAKSGVATQASCAVIDKHVGGFTVADCQQKFCESGLEGYQAFLVAIIEAARENAVPAVVLIAVAFLIQVLQLYFFKVIRSKTAKIVAHQAKTPAGNMAYADPYNQQQLGVFQPAATSEV